MRTHLTHALVVMTCLTIVAYAECANDHRSDKHGGIVVIDFTIIGTTTVSSTELARLTRDFVGSCYNDESEEMQERLRAGFQNRGYFAVNVKSLSVKPRDPLGIPKPVTVEAEVGGGRRTRVGGSRFLEIKRFALRGFPGRFRLKKAMWSR